MVLVAVVIPKWCQVTFLRAARASRNPTKSVQKTTPHYRSLLLFPLERSIRRTSPLCPVSIPHPLWKIPSSEIESSHICQDKGTDRKLVDLEWNQIISEFSHCKRSRLVTINTFDQWSMSIHLMSQFVWQWKEVAFPLLAITVSCRHLVGKGGRGLLAAEQPICCTRTP